MKKTLILCGSPRRNGDTASLLHQLIPLLDGEVNVEYVFENGIGSCRDCRACRKQRGCVLNDGAERLYTLIEECDNVLIASPVWYGSLTGRLMEVMSRLQTYFSARAFRGEELLQPKKGGILLTAGGCGGGENAVATARILLKSMNAVQIFTPILHLQTDTVRPDAEGLPQLAKFFNE